MREVMFSPENGDRSRAPNIAVVLTDGASSRDSDKTVPYSAEARTEGITIFAIGIGEAVNTEELLGIAGTPDKVIHVSNFDALDMITSQITTFACDLPSSKLLLL